MKWYANFPTSVASKFQYVMQNLLLSISSLEQFKKLFFINRLAVWKFKQFDFIFHSILILYSFREWIPGGNSSISLFILQFCFHLPMGKNLNNDSDERIVLNPRLEIFSPFQNRNEHIRPSILNLITSDHWGSGEADLIRASLWFRITLFLFYCYMNNNVSRISEIIQNKNKHIRPNHYQ